MTYNYNLGVKQDKNLLAVVLVTLAAVLLVGLLFSARAGAATGGFDQYGYNDKARVFVGDADGVDRMDDGKIWGGNEVYADDHLVMKWNKAWDDCNDNGYGNAAYCAGAWTTNQWNGMNPDGSQTIYSYKIIWVGSEGEESSYWKEGGYSIWGNYEVIFEKGTGMETIKAVAPGLGQKNLQ